MSKWAVLMQIAQPCNIMEHLDKYESNSSYYFSSLSHY